MPEKLDEKREDSDKLDAVNSSGVSQRFIFLYFVKKIKRYVYPLFTPNKKER